MQSKAEKRKGGPMTRDAQEHDQAMREIWQQAEEALKAARVRPLTESEISLISWCGNLGVSNNTEKRA
jgi:hypothetical protein